MGGLNCERDYCVSVAVAAAAAVAAGRGPLGRKTPPALSHTLPTPPPVPTDESRSIGEIVTRGDLAQ